MSNEQNKITAEVIKEIVRDTNIYDIRAGSNITYFSEEIALLLFTLYNQIDTLQYKYNIKDMDIEPIVGTLENAKSLPADLFSYIEGKKR